MSEDRNRQEGTKMAGKEGIGMGVDRTGVDRTGMDTRFATSEERTGLEELVRADIGSRPFSELSSVAFDHRGAVLSGKVLLQALADRGFVAGRDFDAVGALTAAAVPFAQSMVWAQAVRGGDLDAFVIDFVYPSIKGPSIRGKRVVLLDAWLSEKSYIQTSSVVTLHRGNELGLDFGVIDHLGARSVAVAALVGGTGSLTGEESHRLRVVNPVDGEASWLPFVYAYPVSALSGRQDSRHDVRA